ncbi:tRNA dihydrouridine synthase DusB [Lamprobacter modestohalophilus]|uniref:tRNA dihydrouridine synthase DusB n=1 Tax=Lamprobacter modestohalophilus TaxID=1064514 RepID=UPI002ADEB497|nr:tRNA dihydrouridine synthase DusB [Lamprobacter modestohalophilus]MEA1048358.1 tRNA dihydrouridine synthase DusB [Lamprobacter modestohalophilus]
MLALDPSAANAAKLLQPLQIGSVSIPNRLILAPMAGVTDQPFRLLCRRLGAGLTISEMVSANPALRNTRKSRERTDHRGEPGPIAVQIAGSDPQQMAEAARHNADCGAELIDINLGCPAKKVCKAAAGSALLRDEALVGRILEAVVRSVDVPVTLKTRTGWSPETRNLANIARIAEASGIQLLTVHGRTRACGYQGEAEVESLAGIREQCALPLVANGDIDRATKAIEVLNSTGADAIMLGRAAMGRPWIFGSMAAALRGLATTAHPASDQLSASISEVPRAPSMAWIGAILMEHLDRLYCFYGEQRGVLIARKHIGWTLRDLRGGSDSSAEGEHLRQRLMATTTAASQLDLLRKHFADCISADCISSGVLARSADSTDGLSDFASLAPDIHWIRHQGVNR